MDGTGGTPLGVAVARVWDGSGHAVGGAFLAAPGCLLTAAHVVNLALGRSAGDTARPDGDVWVDFPVLAPRRRLRAEVAHWVPPGQDSPEDIAGLRLLDGAPEAARPVPLVGQRDPFDRRVVMFGFPAMLDDGVWSVGRLRGPQGSGWVQIDVEDISQFTIQGGFSGVPVWDVDRAAAVGMVVAAWRGTRVRTGYMIPADALFAAWPDLHRMARPPSPFRGLRAFGEQDAEWFFGRTELTERIAGLAGSAPVVTVLGPSGIGKSSIIHAGALPRIRECPGVAVVLARPSEARTPLRSLALALDRYDRPDRDLVERWDSVTELAARLEQGAVGEIVGALLERHGAEQLLLVVDQLEEAFGGAAEHLESFGRVLCHVLGPHSRLRLLAGLRADFLGPALQQPSTTPLVQDQWLVTVGELSKDQLRSVITGPVERVRSVEYEPGLVDRLLQDVGYAPGRLPLVQFTLTELWERQRNGLMTHQAYEELGRLERTLANHAERVWTGLGPAERVVAGRLLVQLLRPMPDVSAFTRRVALRTELDDAQWDMAGRLATARLVVLREPEHAGSAPLSALGAELVHEALVSHWERLRELAEREREFRLWQEGLRQRIQQWHTYGKAGNRLLSHTDLVDARRWERGHAADLSQAEREYLAASRARRRKLVFRLAVAALALAVVAGFTWYSRDAKLRDVAAKDLAAKSADARGSDGYAATQLALRAYRTKDNDAAAKAVRREYTADLYVDRLIPDRTSASTVSTSTAGAGPTGSPTAAAGSAPVTYDLANRVSADGHILVTTTPDLKPAVWRIGRTSVTRMPLQQGGSLLTATAATLGSGGRYAAFVQLAGPELDPRASRTPCNPADLYHLSICVVAYDLTTGRIAFARPVPGATPLRSVQALSIDPSERVLAAVVPAGDSTWRVLRWDLPSGRERAAVTLPGRSESIAGFWLAPGGGQATVVELPPQDLNRRRDGGVLAHLDLDASPVGRRVLVNGLLGPWTVAVSADGRRLATALTAGYTGPAQFGIWDVASGALRARVDQPESGRLIGGIALDSAGDRLFVGWMDFPFPAGTGDTDVRNLSTSLARAYTRHVSVWSLGGQARSTPARSTPAPSTPAPARELALDLSWAVARPLGTTEDSPVALLRKGAVGIMFPAGPVSPLARLTGTSRPLHDSSPDPAEAARRLCSILTDHTESDSTRKLRPAGADGGPLCP